MTSQSQSLSHCLQVREQLLLSLPLKLSSVRCTLAMLHPRPYLSAMTVSVLQNESHFSVCKDVINYNQMSLFVKCLHVAQTQKSSSKQLLEVGVIPRRNGGRTEHLSRRTMTKNLMDSSLNRCKGSEEQLDL